jgi:hypothetical protein
MHTPKVILLEFNELCPDLMDQFIQAGRLPNFKKLRSESHVYMTDAGEQAPNLEPWIQWVTVHCGLPYREHKVFHLGEGPKSTIPCIWDILSKAGHKVAVCGSMNVRYDKPINGYVLPDPWTTGAEPYPDSLLPYAKFVQINVQEHSNDQMRLSRSDYLKFLAFMQTHGLSIPTISSIVKQLMSEKGGKNRWKRAAILDKLQFDLFRSYFKKLSPSFSTFFLNSTAHLQHTYWRNLQPELFKIKPSEEEQEEFAAAILFGYQQMDELVGRFLDLSDDDTVLIFSTALSQQPCLIYEEQGGKVLFRPRDFDRFLQFAGITARCTVSPVMAEQFYIYFENERDAAESYRKLEALQVDGKPAMLLSLESTAIFANCGLFTDQSKNAVLHIADSERSTPFFDIFYKIEGMKSGMHHPDGMLWIRTAERRQTMHAGKVPLTTIAPTILDMFGVTAPEYMKGGVLEAVTAAHTAGAAR